MGKDGLGGDLGGPTDLEKPRTRAKAAKHCYEVGRITPLGYYIMGRFLNRENAEKLLNNWNSKCECKADLAKLNKVKFDD